MLIELDIQNLGVIQRAQLPLSPGFTVLTGETGAGKTMVLNALALLMGGKHDPKLIRHGCDKLAIDGSWDISTRRQVQDLVRQVGGEIDDDGTVIATRLASLVRSKSLLGGRTIPQSMLAEFTRALVTVHGQADQIRLRTPSRQRAALDEYGSATQLQYQMQLARYRELWHRQIELQSQYDTLTTAAVERNREAELLRLTLSDIERVKPEVGEHAGLASQALRLANVESLRMAASTAHQALAGVEDAGGDVFALSAVGALDAARRALAQGAKDDASLGPLAQRSAEAGYLVADLIAELASYLAQLDADPEQLEAVQARLGELNSLARRLGLAPDAISEWAATAALRLEDLDQDETAITELASQLAAIHSHLAETAAELTAERLAAAKNLAAAVSQELAGLGMKEASLQVLVEPGELGAAGQDKVEFQLVPHVGAPPSPVSKGASGGELSRVMLALELTLAVAQSANLANQSAPPFLPTFVFDEVDAGVGGKAAVEVGRRLARLAQLTQVIVVTHLPQVAAFADQHLVVTKLSGETGVALVSGENREREIARMLSGTETSATALNHARELLASAQFRAGVAD